MILSSMKQVLIIIECVLCVIFISPALCKDCFLYRIADILTQILLQIAGLD